MIMSRLTIQSYKITLNLHSTSSLRDFEEEDFTIENDPSVHVDNVNDDSASNEIQAEIDDQSMLGESGGSVTKIIEIDEDDIHK